MPTMAMVIDALMQFLNCYSYAVVVAVQKSKKILFGLTLSMKRSLFAWTWNETLMPITRTGSRNSSLHQVKASYCAIVTTDFIKTDASQNVAQHAAAAKKQNQNYYNQHNDTSLSPKLVGIAWQSSSS